MKTFETEKHNIPEGATHYIEESRIMTFGWAKGLGTDGFSVYPVESGEGRWIGTSEPIHAGVLKPIPQANIETPEEKEVDWVCVEGFNYEQVDFNSTLEKLDGDICIDSDLYFAWSNKNIVHISEVSAKELLMNRHKLCKRLETEAERVERERLESAYDLYCTGNKGLNVTAPCTFDVFESDEIQCKFWLAIVDKTSYRKESE
jgi:hypothetical protein